MERNTRKYYWIKILQYLALLLIYEITESVLDYPFPHQNKKIYLFLSPPTYLLNIMLSTTQTLSEIKSQESIGHVRKHFIRRPLTYITNGIQDFVKCCIKSWLCTSTFDLTTCYLVDCNLNIVIQYHCDTAYLFADDLRSFPVRDSPTFSLLNCCRRWYNY